MGDRTKTSLQLLMRTPLPSITDQKKLLYRPTRSQVISLYNTINEHIFNNRLVRPQIEVASHCRKYWGVCYGYYELRKSRSYCEIRLMDKWYCIQWLITVLAHEMVHQYQWDVHSVKREKNGYNPIMSHGPSFRAFKRKLERYGIPLKTSHSKKKWFNTQDILKC
jgi:hypothetical protein